MIFADVRRIGGGEAVALAKQYIELSADDLTALQIGADASDPAMAVFMGETLVALVGFIPIGIIAGTVFVWMQEFPDLAKYRIGMMRMGRRMIAEVRKKYPRIIGQCSGGPRSENWWKSLGAEFEPGDAKTKTFVIGGVL